VIEIISRSDLVACEIEDGGRSVSIVHSRTQAMQFSVVRVKIEVNMKPYQEISHLEDTYQFGKKLL
jgi:hypothetical protein